MENGIWNEWSPSSPCFGDICHPNVQSRWRDCNQSKQLVDYLRCVGGIKPQCKLLASPAIYPGGRKTSNKKHNPMDVELSEKNDTGKGGPHSKSDENNSDFHVHCNIQCRPGQDCQKLRAKCLKAGQGRAKVKVSTNEIKTETGHGETGMEGSSVKGSKKGAQLKEKPVMEPPKLFYPTGFRIAVLGRKPAKKTKQRASRPTERRGKRSVDLSEPLPTNITFIANGIGNEVEVAQLDTDNSVSPPGIEKVQKIMLKHSKEVKAVQQCVFDNNDDVDDDDDDDGEDDDDDDDDDDDEDHDDDDEDEDFDNENLETNPKRKKRSIEDENYGNDMGLDHVRDDDRNEGNDEETSATTSADTFSSDIRDSDKSASQFEPKKEDYGEKVGNLNNQKIDIVVRPTKDRNIIGKQRKHPSLLSISTYKPNIYITEAEKYRRETYSQASTSMIPAAKVILPVPMKLVENTASKYCK